MVLLPSVVQHPRIKTVPLHALVKQTQSVFVVRLLFELQTAAVLHVLLKLNRAAAAQIVERRLQLLLFDVLVLLVLVLAGKVLPR